MTVPNGIDGINVGDTVGMVSAYGHGDMSAADLVGNDQDTMRALYANKYVLNGNSVLTDPTSPLAAVWDGLRQGISLPLSIIEAIVKRLFGIDLNFDNIFDALGAIQSIEDVVAAVGTVVSSVLQQVMDAIVSGLSGGGSTTGSDPLSIVLAFATAGLTLPLQVIDQLWAAIAQLSAGQQAVQNSPGTVLIDDFASVGVSGYTNITGTLAVSSAGPYLQTPHTAVAYRTTSPASDQQGAQIVIDANQQGWCGVGICSDTAATSYALLQVYSGFQGDAIRLLTGSSPTVAVVQAQTDFITTRLANTNTFDIWYEVATNTFHVLRNGLKVFDWIDATNIITHDASHRKVLVISNGENNAANGSYGPGIRKLTAYVKT